MFPKQGALLILNLDKKNYAHFRLGQSMLSKFKKSPAGVLPRWDRAHSDRQEGVYRYK